MDIPKDYNIAQDCVDRYARFMQTQDQRALTHVRVVDGEYVEQSLTFGNLARLTNRMANALRALGLDPGQRIILRLPNGPEFPVTFLGAMKAGLIPIPTSPALKWHELNFMLEDSGAAALITQASLRPAELAAVDPTSLCKIVVASPAEILPGEHRFADLVKQASADFQVQMTRADDPAYWLYTSGTEDRPKAVIHAHRSIPAHDDRVRLWQDLNQDDVIFNTSALNWSYALTCSLLDAWRHRVQTLLYDGMPDPRVLVDLIRRYQVTVLMSVPGIYRRLTRTMREQSLDLPGLRVALSAGESLPQEIREQFFQLTGVQIREGLGMTEHSVYLVQRQDETPVPGSCGRPLPSTRVAVLQEDLSEAAPEEVGILASHRSCPGLMLGYHERPELEAQSFRGDWFLSGDLARRDREGNYYFIGRRDDVITAGGYRISPLEVERVLQEHPDVMEAAVVTREIETDKRIIAAVVVPRQDGTRKLADAIMHFAGQRLAAYKVPRSIEFRDRLPRTQTGKLKRSELR